MFNRIAVVAAMEREVSFLRKAMTPPDCTKDRFVVGTIGSRTVLLLRTGVGPLKTARRLAEIKKEHAPQCVLSIGCAGALSSNIQIGDVVISEKLIDETDDGRVRCPPSALTETAKGCCQKLGLPFHVGSTVSTNDVAATTEDKRNLAKKYGALAVDMESAQVAAWADGAGVPMLSIRAISDTLADRIPPELATVVDRKGRLRWHKALALFVRHPGLALELIRLKLKFDRSLKSLEKAVMMLLRSI